MNTRQTNFIATLGWVCREFQALYGKAFNLKESFSEEFASNQDNALDELEGNTKVNINSTSGQPVLNVADTKGFKIGQTIIIDEGGKREEVKEILTIGLGTLTLTTNLDYAHTASQADIVRTMGYLYNLGLTYAAISTACNQVLTNFVNFWVGDAVATREYGNDTRRIANNQKME